MGRLPFILILHLSRVDINMYMHCLRESPVYELVYLR